MNFPPPPPELVNIPPENQDKVSDLWPGNSELNYVILFH
jgi:hypothetical protein